ncbi:MAG: acyltransferase [Pseudomonadota bacterium]
MTSATNTAGRSSAVSKERAGSITTLQGGRAIAALMVAVFHLHLFVFPQRIYAETGEGLFTAAAMGYAGVEFFFALSGFLMAYVHARDWGQPERANTYLRKRIARIYPAYWVVVVPLVLASLFVSGVGPEEMPGPLGVIGDLLLVPSAREPILTVAWTLQYEMVFYLIFVLTIMLGRVGLGLLWLWGAACMANLAVGVEGMPFSFIFSAYNLIFLMGIVSALVFRRVGAAGAGLMLVGGLALFFATGLFEAYGVIEYDEGFRTVLYGFGATLIITGLAALEYQRRIACPHGLKVIGDASYMLYLVHMPAFSVAGIVVGQLGLAAFIPPFAMAVGLLAGVTAGSILLHYWVEKPLVRFANALLTDRRVIAG